MRAATLLGQLCPSGDRDQRPLMLLGKTPHRRGASPHRTSHVAGPFRTPGSKVAARSRAPPTVVGPAAVCTDFVVDPLRELGLYIAMKEPVSCGPAVERGGDGVEVAGGALRLTSSGHSGRETPSRGWDA